MIINKQDRIIILAALVLLLVGCVQEEQLEIQPTTNETNEIDEIESVNNEVFVEPVKTIVEHPEVDLNWLEEKIHILINEERKKEDLKELFWDPEVAEVARKHSQEQAEYNQITTNPELFNPIPLIYHEGFTTGLYQDERLGFAGIDYYYMSGENISIISIVDEAYYETYGSGYIEYPSYLSLELERPWETSTEARSRVLQKIEHSIELTESGVTVEWFDFDYYSDEELATEIVNGWMDSPGHRGNILESEFNHTGIGVAKVNEYYIATQVFLSTTNCGYLGAVCCAETGYYPWCYEPLNCVSNVCVK